MRHFPDFENPAKPLVHDITMSMVSNVKVEDAWAGDADVRFMPSAFEEVADLGPIEVTGGFSFGLGLTISGGKGAP